MEYVLRKSEDKNLSNLHGVIFVHIAKAAGTSVWKNLGMTKFTRGIFTVLQLKDIIPNDKFNSYCKFTVVRNPWDRMVSLYEYIKKEKHDEYIYNNNNYEFKDWLMNPHVKGLRDESILFQPNFYRDYFQQLGMEWYKIHKHWLPQLNMISDENDNICVDIILKFESLDSDWEEFSKHIGRELSPLKKHNTTKKKDYKEYYDSETIDYVSKLYHKDIASFNYKFEE